MGKYIHLFETEVELESAYFGKDYIEPWVATSKDDDEVTFNKGYAEMLKTPLTFEISSGGNITWTAQSTAYTTTIEYRKNYGEWTEITANTGGTNIAVVPGDVVQFRGDNDAYAISDSTSNCFSGATAGFKVKGNIMSLVNSTGFSTATTLQTSYTFYNLFRACTGLTDASELVLPVLTLTPYCYNSMFRGCRGLNAPPAILPATTLADRCYFNMFESCFKLTTSVPVICATTLASHCCFGMFMSCTGLTTAPELLATTLTEACYYYMFGGCKSLTTAPKLPAKALASGCYKSMFEGCTSLTTAPELPATALTVGCYQSMFNGCKSLTTAPELPATTLGTYCYQSMFQNCTSLSRVTCLATNITANGCTSNWLNNVASSGTFTKSASMTEWTSGVNGIPANWTVQDAG